MKKNVIKSAFYCAGFVLADQIIKLIIAAFYMDSEIVLIKGTLFFIPVQNTSLTWLTSKFNVYINRILLFFILVLVTVIAVIIFMYVIYLIGKYQKLCYFLLSVFTAGLICLLIDVLFWGGSIDYIKIFDWFIFDLKDIYTKTALPVIILYFIEYVKLTKEERRQKGFADWIRKNIYK